jgi:hypothetical protein
MTRIVLHRPADFFWNLTTRPLGPVTRSESRSPTEAGDRRAAFHPTTFVTLALTLALDLALAGANIVGDATTNPACAVVTPPDGKAGMTSAISTKRVVTYEPLASRVMTL